MTIKRVIILGATGSIGLNSFDVIKNLGSSFQIVGAACHANVDELLRLAEEFQVPNLAVSSKRVDNGRITFSGPNAIQSLIMETEADIVINGIAGSPGLMPSVWSLQRGFDLALANKETIVMAGPLIRSLAARTGAQILPVDSEHSAIFQLLRREKPDEIEKVVITASGGPFRNTPLSEFPALTLEDALQHPTWDMGSKITIDSATMGNKGLEVIEAHHLFDLDTEQIQVLIHPQSCVHSLIKTVEGSYYAQISHPDMRIPIQNALTYPRLAASPFGDLDLADTDLSFQHPDPQRFPLLQSAFQAIRYGGAYPLAYNAANEVAVKAFQELKIRFVDIAAVVDATLQKDWSVTFTDFSHILETHSRVWTQAETEVLQYMEHN
ncbi:MAG: 1-deoxy-D-xylulose-5-phosphate reductoisomerase [Spirochaetaceae bacterium]|nr:1-deoxy-D-xylulose-5-phosphate reductoisomerase [Spirochaetaceae bacterium]MCF7947484.1 1-deoxy-D-xylulose-5-phosphate reductoisomerase [Spirochaetia bacterium]MCF7950590.1 1-deoxy-D-xylulose-5-phosphate reductoisomerase [Spirochaetaceae bacterium]